MKQKQTLYLMIIMMGATLLFSTPIQQESAKELFEKAIYLEETKGDLEGAIELFQRVAKDFPEERTTAAQALFHMGLCYEKLGNREAQKAFQSVIDSYPDQAETVELARAKLAATTRAKAAPKAEDRGFNDRLLLSGPELLYDGWLGAVSPDGKYVSIVDWETNDLAIRDLATGEKRRLTEKNKENGYPLYSRWSPDSKKIVYDWWSGKSFVDLRIIDIEKMEPVSVFNKAEACPFDWCADGEHILIEYADNGIKMALLSWRDGTVQIIKQGWPNMNARISPDGRFVAYNKPQKDSSAENDVYICSIEDGIDIPLITHSSNDGVLGWAPDGRMILFQSARLGSVDAWLVPFKDGKADGDPLLMKKGIKGSSALGLTKNGSFFYMTSKSMEDLYSASIDPKSGEILEAPKKMGLPEQGRNGSPAFSPDGKKLAYLSSHRDKYSLRIFSIETEKEQVYPLQFRALHPRWSPDGRTVLITALPRPLHHGIFQVDLGTGLVNSVIPNENRAEEDIYDAIGWAPSGKAFYFVHIQREGKDKIYRYDLELGTSELIHQTDDRYGTQSLSPDGKWLAFLGREVERELTVIPSLGGEARVLCRFLQKGGPPIEMAWTPDGGYVLFFHSAKKEVLKQELCRIAFSGGELEVLDVSMVDPDDPAVHPNGQDIVFNSEGFAPGYPEYWVIENFLPKTNKKK